MGLHVPSKTSVYYPSVSLPLKAVPEARKWDIGRTYEVTLRVTMTGMHQSRHSDGNASFDIKAVGVKDAPVKERGERKPARRYAEDDEA